MDCRQGANVRSRAVDAPAGNKISLENGPRAPAAQETSAVKRQCRLLDAKSALYNAAHPQTEKTGKIRKLRRNGHKLAFFKRIFIDIQYYCAYLFNIIARSDSLSAG